MVWLNGKEDEDQLLIGLEPVAHEMADRARSRSNSDSIRKCNASQWTAETGTGGPVGIMKERSDVDGSAEISCEPVRKPVNRSWWGQRSRLLRRYMPRFQEGKVRRGAIVVD